MAQWTSFYLGFLTAPATVTGYLRFVKHQSDWKVLKYNWSCRDRVTRYYFPLFAKRSYFYFAGDLNIFVVVEIFIAAHEDTVYLTAHTVELFLLGKDHPRIQIWG